MKKLSEEKLKNAKHVFSLYEGKDQKLSFAEFGTAIRSLGIPITDPEVNDIIRDMEVIGNENIDLPEFIGLITKKYKDLDLKEELEEGFNLFDRKKNGTVLVNELRFVFSNLCCKLNKRDIDMLLLEENLKAKKEINFDDFQKLMIN